MSTCRVIAARMVAPGKGVLAADESIGTMSQRPEKAAVEPTAENRRIYRELLSSGPNLSDGVSGIIYCDETLRQTFGDSTPFAQAVHALGLQPTDMISAVRPQGAVGDDASHGSSPGARSTASSASRG